MTNEKFFPQYVLECRYRWADSEIPVAAQAVVADPDGGSAVTLWIARDFCLRLWRWTVHLHSFLNRSKDIFARQGILPWRAGRLASLRTIPKADISLPEVHIWVLIQVCYNS